MATNESKKAFLVYCDWYNKLNIFSLEQYGMFFKFLLEYTNDLYPDDVDEPEEFKKVLPEDPMVQFAITWILPVLKTDLNKYRERKARMQKINEERKRRNDNDTILTRNRNEVVGVNSNQLIVNSNQLFSNENNNKKKSISNDILKEKREDNEKLTPLQVAINEFISMRNKIKKPLTANAKTRMMNKLEKLSNGDEELKIAILNQSVDHCWQDIYEFKEEHQNKSSSSNSRPPLLKEI